MAANACVLRVPGELPEFAHEGIQCGYGRCMMNSLHAPKRALVATIAALCVPLAFTATSQAATKKAPAKTKPAATKKAVTITACVKKKTGALTIVTGKKAKKKCPKGSTKLTWNVSGPAGKNGANGLPGASGTNGINGSVGAPGLPGLPGADGGSLKLRDATGKVLGTNAGVISIGPGLTLYQVIGDDGGLYDYLDNGQLVPLSLLIETIGGGILSPTLYTSPSCTGTAYEAMAQPLWAGWYSKQIGSPARFVDRAFTGSLDFTTGFDLSFGPARAWKLTSTARVVQNGDSTVYYGVDPTTGSCSSVGPVPSGGGTSYVLVTLASVPAPPDGVGPLSLS